MTRDGEASPAREHPLAVVQEATCSERVVVLKVRVIGGNTEGPKASLVIVAAPAGAPPGAGITTSEARRQRWGGKLPSGLAQQRARADALAHARIVALGPTEAFIEQQGMFRVIRALRDRVVVTDDSAPPSATPFMAMPASDLAGFESRGLELMDALAASAIVLRRAEVGQLLGKARERIRRRRAAIASDLEKIGEADRIATQAEWLIAEAARTPRGATKLVATDWSTGEAVPIEIALDPAKSAKDQVAAMFKRAKRLRLGGRIANERLEQTAKQLAAIEDELQIVTGATALAAIEESVLRAKRAAPRDVTLPSATSVGSKKAGSAPVRLPYRTFTARSGRKLLVGKGAADNDALTLHVARPHDLWLHAKDRTGAHVIVMLDRGQTAPSEDLVDAAHFAAHFSDAREEKVVDIQYADRRHLRKPKGSPPGFVIVDREKVLVLRVEPELVRALLEREET